MLKEGVGVYTTLQKNPGRKAVVLSEQDLFKGMHEYAKGPPVTPSTAHLKPQWWRTPCRPSIALEYCDNYDCYLSHWEEILTSCHVEESWFISRGDSTTIRSRWTLISKLSQFNLPWVILLKQYSLSTFQAATPHIQRSVISDQKHPRSNTPHGWLQWTQLFVIDIMMWTPGVKSLRDSLINTICVFSMTEHTYLKPQAQHVNKPNISDWPHNLHTRTRSEKCVGGAARYPWQRTLSHTNFYPTISGRDTPKLWSFPLFFFQGQLGHLCRVHNQGCKWLHPTIPKKSNPWFDEKCQEALKARRALDKSVQQSRENWEGNHICFQKVTGSVTLHSEETSVMGRICLEAVNWYSY